SDRSVRGLCSGWSREARSNVRPRGMVVTAPKAIWASGTEPGLQADWHFSFWSILLKHSTRAQPVRGRQCCSCGRTHGAITIPESGEAGKTPKPKPALKRLDRLVGTWRMSGHPVGATEDSITGTTTFAWLDGGFFLVQDMSMDYDGKPITSHELIGFDA